MGTPYVAQYLIILGDATQVAALQAQFPTGIQTAPRTAAATYSAPIAGIDTPTVIVPRVQLALDVFAWASATTHLSEDRFSFTYAAGTPWAQPYDATWVGTFLHEGPGIPPSGEPAIWVGRRRWIDGFEGPESTVASTNSGVSRAASRTPEGRGMAYRGAAVTRTKTVPVSTRLSWERFYIRLLKLPSGNELCWNARGSGEGTPALHIDVLPSGALAAYSLGNGVFPGDLLGTSSILTLNRWYRIDFGFFFLHDLDPGVPVVPEAGSNSASLYLDGVGQFTAGGVLGRGLGLDQLHSQSQIGNPLTQGGTNDGEWDLDDWINAEGVCFLGDDACQVVGGGSATCRFPGNPLALGSHIRLVRATRFTPDHNAVAWPGDFRTLLDLPREDLPIASVLTTTSPGALAGVETDYQDEQRGCPAFAVGGAFLTSPVGQTEQIGYKTASSGITLTPTVITSAFQWIYAAFTLAAQQPLPLSNLTSVNLYLQKDGTASTVSLQNLLAAAEFLGVWGAEDLDPTKPVAVPPRLGIHNAPYGQSGESLSITPPVGILAVMAGTYVGNGTGQDILLPHAVHWWYVRPLTGAVSGVRWVTSMVGAHENVGSRFQADRLPQALLDSQDGPCRLRLGTGNAASNAAGVTYQYVAVSDPALRYLLNGAFAHESGTATASNPLIDPTYLPDAAFFALESDASGGSSGGCYYRGPGHAGNDGSPLDGATVATVAAFASGAITSLATLNNAAATNNIAYNCWRRDDGSGVTGWFDVTSYVGNGAGGTRYISVRLNGQPPGVFALVVPHNAAAFVRDPSETGTTSRPFNNINTTSATAIVDVSRPDQIGVGTTLNANGVVYDVFVIGGTGNGVFYPVAPRVRPTPGPWTAPAPTIPDLGNQSCAAPSDGAVTSGQGCAAPLLP
jgi:hypothetical protein